MYISLENYNSLGCRILWRRAVSLQRSRLQRSLLSPTALKDRAHGPCKSQPWLVASRKFDRGLGQILHDQLHWLDVPDRVLFKPAVTVHQCLNGRAPPYLSEHCIPVSSAITRRHLRSANRHLLAVPHFRLNTYGRRAFSVAGPMAWNSLPDFIRDPTSSTDWFRRLLKT